MNGVVNDSVNWILSDCDSTDRRAVAACRLLSFTLREGWRGAVGTCSGGTNYREASRGRRGAVAGLHVFWDATVGGQLMAKGRAELRELLLGLCGGQKIA